MPVPFNAPPIAPLEGPVAGILGGLQQYNLMRGQDAALMEMALRAEQQRAETERYRGISPGMVAESDLKGAQSRAQIPYAQDFALGRRGEDQVHQVRGRQALALEEGDTGAKQIANTVKAIQEAARYLEMQRAASPMWGEAEYRRFHASLPKQIASVFPATWTEDVPEQMNTLSTMLMQSPEHRRAMELQKTQTEGQIEVARGNNAATRYTADRSYDRAVDVAQLRMFMDNNKQNFQQFLTQYAQKRASGTNTPQDDMMAKMIEQMMYQARQAGAGTIDPNAGMQQVFPNIQPRPAPPSAIPQAGPTHRWNPQTGRIEPIGR